MSVPGNIAQTGTASAAELHGARAWAGRRSKTISHPRAAPRNRYFHAIELMVNFQGIHDEQEVRLFPCLDDRRSVGAGLRHRVGTSARVPRGGRARRHLSRPTWP